LVRACGSIPPRLIERKTTFSGVFFFLIIADCHHATAQEAGELAWQLWILVSGFDQKYCCLGDRYLSSIL
jgi:hypothetical protein